MTGCSSPTPRAGCTPSCSAPAALPHPPRRHRPRRPDRRARGQRRTGHRRGRSTSRCARCWPTTCCRCRAAPQVIYPKDAAQIVAMGDIFPGARVLEAGAGSGALDLLAAARGRRRRPGVSYERRQEFAEVARTQRRAVLRRPAPGLAARVGDLADAEPPSRSTGSCWTCWRPGRSWTPSSRGAGARRRPRRLRRHRDPAVPARRGAAGARRLHRAGGLRDARPALARRRARGPARSTGWSRTPRSWSRPGGSPTGSPRRPGSAGRPAADRRHDSAPDRQLRRVHRAGASKRHDERGNRRERM